MKLSIITLKSSSKLVYMRSLRDTYLMTDIKISEKAKAYLLEACTQFRSERDRYLRSSDNRANVAVTSKDCLHLINSAIAQNEGGKFICLCTVIFQSLIDLPLCTWQLPLLVVKY